MNVMQLDKTLKAMYGSKVSRGGALRLKPQKRTSTYTSRCTSTRGQTFPSARTLLHASSLIIPSENNFNTTDGETSKENRY
jgi:hypothetical protein